MTKNCSYNKESDEISFWGCRYKGGSLILHIDVLL